MATKLSAQIGLAASQVCFWIKSMATFFPMDSEMASMDTAWFNSMKSPGSIPRVSYDSLRMVRKL